MTFLEAAASWLKVPAFCTFQKQASTTKPCIPFPLENTCSLDSTQPFHYFSGYHGEQTCVTHSYPSLLPVTVDFVFRHPHLPFADLPFCSSPLPSPASPSSLKVSQPHIPFHPIPCDRETLLYLLCHAASCKLFEHKDTLAPEEPLNLAMSAR